MSDLLRLLFPEFFIIKHQQGNLSLLRDPHQSFFFLMSRLSSELTAELISLLRTHYQGSLGVQVCVCVLGSILVEDM